MIHSLQIYFINFGLNLREEKETHQIIKWPNLELNRRLFEGSLQEGRNLRGCFGHLKIQSGTSVFHIGPSPGLIWP